MKVRQSFVTNSSSSSFIICIKEPPDSKEDLAKMLFTEEQLKDGCWYDDSNLKYPLFGKIKCSETAQFIWDFLAKSNHDDCKYNIFNNINSTFLLAEALYGYEYDKNYPNYNNYNNNDEFHSDLDDYTYKFAKEYMYKNLDNWIFAFTFCDHNGSVERAIENIGCFSKIDPNYIKISYH